MYISYEFFCDWVNLPRPSRSIHLPKNFINSFFNSRVVLHCVNVPHLPITNYPRLTAQELSHPQGAFPPWSLIEKMPYSWISWRHFLNWSSFLCDNYSLCQVDRKLASTDCIGENYIFLCKWLPIGDSFWVQDGCLPTFHS
jgi:hypothetical protein